MTERTAPGTDSIPIADGFDDATATDDREFDEHVRSSLPDHGARNTRVIWLLLGATFVVFLNETIMSVAIPELVDDLGVTLSAAQWLTTAFMLTMAVVIPVTGFVLQRITTRPAFLLAMTLFAAGTLICALAPGFVVLLGGRIVQATGTAIMLPLLMTTVMTVTPPAGRGRTMGNISVVISVAPAIGPTISGLILSVLSWRWMFGLVLPIAVVAIALGALRLPNVTEPRYAKVDVPSVILSALGFGGIVYGLSGLGELTEVRICRDRGVEVQTLQQAVPGNVSEDDRRDTRVLEPSRDVERRHFRRLGPALDRDFTVTRI